MGIPLRIALSVCFIVSGNGFAQTATKKPAPPFTSVPAIEDRELYYAFFNYHQALITAMAAAKAADPTKAAQIDQRIATLLQVDLKELPTVTANIQKVTQDYTKLAADRLAGSIAVPKGTPPLTPAQASSVAEFMKVRLTTAAVVNLIQQLSPASWNGLHSYIVGTYKATIYKH